MLPKAVIYVNFSQYDNTGRILDYLREQFPTVLHFSFDHLRLKNGRKTNLITIYKKGKPTYINTLYSLRVPEFFLFPSLPLVGILMAIQTIRHSVYLYKNVGKMAFFTVNAYPALIGVLLKYIGVVSNVQYWVWDYYPVHGPSWTLRIIRYWYLIFDMLALRLSDSLIFPNIRQRRLREHLHGIKGNYPIVPLGSSKPVRFHKKISHTIGFLGMLKGSQGLDLILLSFGKVLKRDPAMRLEIIGSGPEEESIRERARPFGNRVKFYGFIEDQNTLNAIARRWFAGLAIYEPVPGNESYFGDPSKIKVYLSQGIPIITTNVTEYGQKARIHKFGISVRYNIQNVVQAIFVIHTKQLYYRKNALQFAGRLYYRNLYKHLLLHSR